jgi:hypothetical protein
MSGERTSRPADGQWLGRFLCSHGLPTTQSRADRESTWYWFLGFVRTENQPGTGFWGESTWYRFLPCAPRINLVLVSGLVSTCARRESTWYWFLGFCARGLRSDPAIRIECATSCVGIDVHECRAKLGPEPSQERSEPWAIQCGKSAIVGAVAAGPRSVDIGVQVEHDIESWLTLAGTSPNQIDARCIVLGRWTSPNQIDARCTVLESEQGRSCQACPAGEVGRDGTSPGTSPNQIDARCTVLEPEQGPVPACPGRREVAGE